MYRKALQAYHQLHTNLNSPSYATRWTFQQSNCFVHTERKFRQTKKFGLQGHQLHIKTWFISRWIFQQSQWDVLRLKLINSEQGVLTSHHNTLNWVVMSAPLALSAACQSLTPANEALHCTKLKKKLCACAISPKNCQLFVKKKQYKWHLMTKFCSGFLAMFFLSPTIIICFHSAHAKSWSVIAGIPHFLRNPINEIVLFGFDLFYSKCIRLSPFQGPKHEQSISLRVHSLNTCEVRFSQCGFHTHSHTNTSKDWIRLGSCCQ